jgi:hypothetical protein
VEVLGRSLPVLTYDAKGKFGTIIFENVMRYLSMDSWHRRILDQYMTEYKVGMIGFVPSSPEELGPSGKIEQLGEFPLFMQADVKIKVSVPRSTGMRNSESLKSTVSLEPWTMFIKIVNYPCPPIL